MTIQERLLQIKSELAPSVKLVAVSKTKPASLIREVYDAGQRVFGENKAQDLAEKYPQLPKDIEWHFIGHLQTNKVKYIAPFVHTIHGVDSLKLLTQIDKQAEKFDRRIQCLLQFHIAEEETKFGLDYREAEELLTNEALKNMRHVQIAGVMGMATFSDDEVRVRYEFGHLRSIFNQLKETYFATDPAFKEISMGMSGDYKWAIEEGSTMVRIGTSIFGNRNH